MAAADRVPLCTALMNVAHHTHSLMRLMRVIVQNEVDATTDFTTLFRGNSLASKILEHFMRVRTSRRRCYSIAGHAVPCMT